MELLRCLKVLHRYVARRVVNVRLDVYVEDKFFNRSFDVEMQISNSDNLAKRMRYYQGLIDMDKLNRGEHSGALGETFIIFICPFDRFNEGRHIYTFKETCAENPNIKLDDGATKIFLSTKGTLDDVDKDIKSFLDYVESGIVKGKFVEEINDAFVDIKSMRKGIKEMLRKGKPLDEILELTGLSIELIKEIAAENSIAIKVD